MRYSVSRGFISHVPVDCASRENIRRRDRSARCNNKRKAYITSQNLCMRDRISARVVRYVGRQSLLDETCLRIHSRLVLDTKEKGPVCTL